MDQLLELEKSQSSTKFELESQLQVARNSAEEKDKEVERLQDQADKVGQRVGCRTQSQSLKSLTC